MLRTRARESVFQWTELMILRDQKFKADPFLFMAGASGCVARGDVMSLTFQNVSPASNVTYSLDAG